jgi:hypothetical protein
MTAESVIRKDGGHRPPLQSVESELRLENGWELEAIDPKKKEREEGDNNGDRVSRVIKKDVIEHDVHDYRTEEQEAGRGEARTDEQAKAAHDLQHRDHIYVAAAHQRSDESTGLALHFRNWPQKVKKSVGSENNEDEPEQDAGNNDDVFHGWLVINSVAVEEKEILTASNDLR